MNTRLFAYGLALFLTLGVLSPAQATPTSTPSDSVRMHGQLVHLLESGDVAQQERAIQLILSFDRTDAFSGRFFRSLTSHLRDVVTESASDPLRIMAVSALYELGSPTAIQHLTEVAATLREGRVRTVAQRALYAYRLEQAAQSQRRLADRVVWGDWM